MMLSLAKCSYQNHDISLSGGTDNAKFFAAVGILHSRTVLLFIPIQDRYTGRFNSEFTFLNDHVKVGENLTMSYTTITWCW